MNQIGNSIIFDFKFIPKESDRSPPFSLSLSLYIYKGILVHRDTAVKVAGHWGNDTEVRVERTRRRLRLMEVGIRMEERDAPCGLILLLLFFYMCRTKGILAIGAQPWR